MLSEVPMGWQQTTIGQVASQNDESLSSKTPTDYEFRYVSIDDVSTGSINGWTSLAFAEAPSRARRIARQGDILLSTVRPYLKSFTRVNGDDTDLVVSTGFAVLRAGAQINPAYLYQLIFSELFIEHLKELMTGSNYPAVKPKDIAAFPFALPPLNEQHRIAEILSSVDASIQATQSVIEQAERVKRGLMEELLTGGLGSEAIERGEVPDGWASSTVKDCLLKIIDYRGKAPPKADTGVPLITAKNIRKGFLSFEADEYIDNEKYEHWMVKGIPQANDILFTTEAPLGNVAMFPSKGVFALGQRVITLRCNEQLNAIYMFYLLQSEPMQNQIQLRATGSTAKGIKSKEFQKITIFFPNIDEQKRIAEILSTVDETIASHKANIEQQSRVKKGLMDDLLTGKVRTV